MACIGKQSLIRTQAALACLGFEIRRVSIAVQDNPLPGQQFVLGVLCLGRLLARIQSSRTIQVILFNPDG